jgi:hypothetical protein
MGPGTGRAMGYCYGFDAPGYTRVREEEWAVEAGQGTGEAWVVAVVSWQEEARVFTDRVILPVIRVSRLPLTGRMR